MKRIYVIFAGVLAILILMIVLVVIHHNSTTQPGKQKTEPERGGPATVYITGTDQLNNYLLAKQFEAVRLETSNYILGRISSKISHAHIENTSLRPDGSISYVVKTDDKPKVSFTVVLTRNAADYTMTFSVPASGFSQALNVYSGTYNGTD